MKRFISLVFLALLLTSATWVLPLAAQENLTLPDFFAQQGSGADKITLVMSGQPFDPTQENCAVNGLGFRIDGQAYLISGGSGGIAVDPKEQDILSGSTAGLMAEDQYAAAIASGDWTAFLPSTIASLNPGDEKVALLVVDNFPSNLTLEGLFNVGNNPTDPINDDALLMTPPIAHGALVYNFVNELLHLRGYSLDHGDANSALWLNPANSQAEFLVQAVDTQGYKTQVIAQAITNAINQVRPNYPNIVVNMSFGILACDVVDDITASESPNQNEYLLKLSETNKTLLKDYMKANGFDFDDDEVQDHIDKLRTALNSSLAAYIAQLTTDADYRVIEAFHKGLIQILIGANDPILNMINEYKGQGIMFIASAGNNGASYSLYPGLWPEVLSVSAVEQGQPLRANWSNAGEAIDTGAWFPLTDPLSIYNPASPGKPVQVFFKGTSFSAPVVSVMAGIKYSNVPPEPQHCQNVIETLYDGLASGFNDKLSTDALNDIFVPSPC